MHSLNIQKLIDTVESAFGEIQYYGSSKEEEHGVGFKLSDIEVTFSISTLSGELKSTFDTQVEGIPAGDYFFTSEVTLDEFIELVRRFKGPETQWP